jgi:hypothetical protein
VSPNVRTSRAIPRPCTPRRLARPIVETFRIQST